MFEDVYTDLRHLARGYLAHERAGHTLQPTALVHEAYVRLQGAGPAPVDRATLLAAAARAMRRALVDHARRRKARKRQQEGERLPLEEAVARYEASGTDLVALDDALTHLAELDARLVRLVELRFFGRLSIEETAEALGVSRPTVVRDWRVARRWLYEELTSEP